jgi:glycosyltransferase involved in cell wall biosynthesis
MQILHTVESYYPSTGGMQEVVKQLSERLVKFGHDVTVATSKMSDRAEKVVNGVKIIEFDLSGNLVGGFKGDIEEYKDFLIKSDFDVIVNFAAQQWASDIAFLVLDQIKAKKVFVPTGFSELYSPKYQGYFESMPNWMKKYDANVFLSETYQDINFARQHGVTQIEIIPNGAAEEEFTHNKVQNIRQQLNISESYFLILHVGSHTGLKGHSEAIKIFNRAKIKNVVLLIVGNDFGYGCRKKCKRKALTFRISPKRLFDKKRLIITSLPREATVACYKEADLFLFPSRIECSPVVLFECMASKTPFLVTDVGNAAEIIGWSGSGLLLKTEKDTKGLVKADIMSSAETLAEIYFNPDLRLKMSGNGFKVWRETFTWERITKRYENLYFKLINVFD